MKHANPYVSAVLHAAEKAGALDDVTRIASKRERGLLGHDAVGYVVYFTEGYVIPCLDDDGNSYFFAHRYHDGGDDYESAAAAIDAVVFGGAL